MTTNPLALIASNNSTLAALSIAKSRKSRVPAGTTPPCAVVISTENTVWQSLSVGTSTAIKAKLPARMSSMYVKSRSVVSVLLSGSINVRSVASSPSLLWQAATLVVINEPRLVLKSLPRAAT